MNTKAEAGIGSLILFIALVLVAAAAAAVFIQTSESLQGKALTTAANSQKQVSTKVQIISAWGQNATPNATIQDLYMKIKLAPGSDAISLNNSYVGVSTTLNRLTYRFNQTGNCSNVANLLYSLNAAKFLVQNRVGYAKIGYLQEGDILDVCVHLPNAVSGDQPLTASFTPSAGTPTTITVTTPSVMTDTKIPLYP